MTHLINQVVHIHVDLSGDDPSRTSARFARLFPHLELIVDLRGFFEPLGLDKVLRVSELETPAVRGDDSVNEPRECWLKPNPSESPMLTPRFQGEPLLNIAPCPPVETFRRTSPLRNGEASRSNIDLRPAEDPEASVTSESPAHDARPRV